MSIHRLTPTGEIDVMGLTVRSYVNQHGVRFVAMYDARKLFEHHNTTLAVDELIGAYGPHVVYKGRASDDNITKWFVKRGHLMKYVSEHNLTPTEISTRPSCESDELDAPAVGAVHEDTEVVDLRAENERIKGRIQERIDLVE